MPCPHQEGMKSLIIYIMRLSGEDGVAPKQMQGEETDCFHCDRGGNSMLARLT